jgi:ATPase subunit of ABC transporter with duplicated ATPase domains
MAHITVSKLAYAHPGGSLLFSDVSFHVAPGVHAALVGANGVGKSTLMKILAGSLEADEGEASTEGLVGYMPQDVGLETEQRTVRELLLSLAPAALRRAGTEVARHERDLAAGEPNAGVALGAAIGDWSSLGGYQLEGSWDASCRRIVRAPFDQLAARPAASLSGGERKRLVLDLLLASDAEVLLLDEPDNFLDVPAKLELELAIRSSKKTVLLISHDRDLLSNGLDAIVTLEAGGAWVHGASYATYPEAREDRQRRLGDAVKRWQEEERRLRELVRIFKERARYSSDWAKKADAAETRWRRWKDEGPPPAPAPDSSITVHMRGADAARRMLEMSELGVSGLVAPFSEEVHFGEHVGLIGPNGSGKSALLDVLAGRREPDAGRLVLGPRVSVGYFTQLQRRTDLEGRVVIDVVLERVGAGGLQRSMAALARYGLAAAARRSYDVLSGGEQARVEVLVLELEGHNLLLLDEPTDNLDVDSAEALESALDSFEGAVLAVSHDRAFLRRMDRFLMVLHGGSVLALPSYESALEALTTPERATDVRLAKQL